MAVKIEDLEKLQLQSTYDELGIKPMWKPDHKASGGKKYIMIPFYDARDVQKVLDHVCKPENWQNEPRDINGKLYMGIGVNIEGHGWNWKFDMGTEKDPKGITDKGKQDAIRFKGEASDALKRAAVQWGVFRNVYSRGEILLDISSDQKTPMTIAGKLLYTSEQISAYCNSINYGAAKLGTIYMDYKAQIEANPRVLEAVKTLGQFLRTLKD